MSEFTRRLSIPEDTKAGEQAAIAAVLNAATAPGAAASGGGGGHSLFGSSSSQPDDHHGRILPHVAVPLARPFEQLIPQSSSSTNNASVSSGADRLLPPMGTTFPLPFLSSGRGSMNPPSLNVLGSPIPRLSLLTEASKHRSPNQHQMALLPSGGTNTFVESKAELYERIREQARLQTLAEASHLFEPGGALSAAAAGSGGSAPSSSTASQNLPLMLENIRALVNPSSGSSSSTNIQVDTTVQEKLKLMEEAYRKQQQQQQQQPQVKKPSGTLVVLPLKDKERRASFPMPSSTTSRAPAGILSLSNCRQKWNELQQRTSDPTKTPIPMPDAFVREFFARSLHDKNTHQGRLHNKVHRLLLLRLQQQAAACARSNNDEGTGGSEDCGSSNSTSEPLKKRLKRSYAASR